MSIEKFSIDNEAEADCYLSDLLDHPKYRSMDVVEQHASRHINDARIKAYFITKAREMLGSENK